MACADDIGSALQDIRSSATVATQFALYERISALTLKPSKCVLVPAAMPLADFEVHARVALADVCPSWLEFAFKPSSKFLGWLLGPEASPEEQWREAVLTFLSRTESIAATDAPAIINCRLYNQRAVPVLSYLPLFGVAPQSLWRTEARAVHRTLRMPFNSVTLKSAAHLGDYGLPNVVSVAGTCAAVGARFALKHEPLWRRLFVDLCNAAQMHGRIEEVAQGCISPRPWRTIAVFEYLLQHIDGHDVARVQCGFGRAPAQAARLSAAETRRRAALSSSAAQIRKLKALASPPRSPQKFILDGLLKTFLPCDLVTLLQARTHSAIGERGTVAQWQQTLAVAKKLALKDKDNAEGGCRRAAFAWIRLVLNAMPTSARTQAEQRACIFGCPLDIGRDSASHYLCCPRARRIVTVATQAPAPPARALDFVLGGNPPTRHGVLQTAVFARLIVVARMSYCRRGAPASQRKKHPCARPCSCH